MTNSNIDTSNSNTDTDEKTLQSHLNRETARIAWPELERMFAAGRLLAVAPELDLVSVAAALAEDRKDLFSGWLQRCQVEPLSDSCAGRWADGEPELWAVVVAPWVLVQERSSAASSRA